MPRFVYLLIWLLAYLLIPISPALAADFLIDYDLQYAVAPSGVTIVTQKVTLTNQQTNLYPKEYTVTIDTEKIQSVIARDSVNLIKPQINKTGGKTEIRLAFNEQVVGIGKQLTFTLRYENLDIARKNGSIWEVNIPGVVDSAELSSYLVSLQVPPTFGPNAYLTPKPGAGSRWTKEQMTRGGISAAYGMEQVFAGELTYHLNNSQVAAVKTEIALPPDAAFQKVFIEELDPKPAMVTTDVDGNWLATYTLAPLSSITVRAKMLFAVTLSARPEWIQEPPNKEKYLEAQQYWEVNDPKIKELAKTYNTPRAIYQYVSNHLSYDYKRVSETPIRRGALGALASPAQAICMEFTDLFIAMARAAGIPAREVVGYAYTTNSKLRPLSLVADVLHAWPEYYDSEHNVWIPVDPTWANTTGGVDYFGKLDFNHIAFAIRGASSSYPYPAGFYRLEGNQKKDVSISFSDRKIPTEQGKLLTIVEFPTRVSAGRVARGELIVENTSGTAIPSASIAIDASPFAYKFSKEERAIAPFAKFSYPIIIDASNYLTRGKGQIQVTVNGDTKNVFFDIQPLYWLLVPIAAIIFGSVFLVWAILKKK